ncbi:MAG: hypothetical protein ACOCV3_00315 [Halanaerobiales bacterium]
MINIYEPFTTTSTKIKNKMTINFHSLKIEEVNQEEQIAFKIKYFILPCENFAALVRRVTLKNLTNKSKYFEVLDGLLEIVPSIDTFS